MALDVEAFLKELDPDPKIASKQLMQRFDSLYWNDGKADCGPDSIAAHNLMIEFVTRAGLNDQGLNEVDIEIGVEDFKSESLTLTYMIDKHNSLALQESVKSTAHDFFDDYFGKGNYDFGFAVLDKSEKLEIHGHLNRIRELIDSSDLSTRKKNRLFQKLSKLAAEVDKNGTDTDAFFAFLGDAGFALGEMAENAEPFTNEVKDMMRIVFRSREKQEGISLPAPDQNPLLPSSK